MCNVRVTRTISFSRQVAKYIRPGVYALPLIAILRFQSG